MTEDGFDIPQKKKLKVALVHDYLNEFGGAERVLAVLAEMFPQAPIYTAFYRQNSPAHLLLKDRILYTSWAQKIPFFHQLASPLRFLAPLIWESFNFDGYDLVISSASWYITKGILTRPETLHLSYIHTPPRYLYGYETAINWQKYFPVRFYARLVNHFLRQYDFAAAQRPNVLIANSENTRRRIQKFYRRDAVVIYPPVELPRTSNVEHRALNDKNYFLTVSRLIGGKGLKLAVQACAELNLPLKVVGEAGGWSREYQRLKPLANEKIEFLGHVSDQELVKLYSGAKAFLAVARDEDFGITPVEAMLCGTPVIAYRGGGYLETVIDGKTGVFFDNYSVISLKKAIKEFRARSLTFNPAEIKKQAKNFSKAQFIKKIKMLIKKEITAKSR